VHRLRLLVGHRGRQPGAKDRAGVALVADADDGLPVEADGAVELSGVLGAEGAPGDPQARFEARGIIERGRQRHAGLYVEASIQQVQVGSGMGARLHHVVFAGAKAGELFMKVVQVAAVSPSEAPAQQYLRSQRALQVHVAVDAPDGRRAPRLLTGGAHLAVEAREAETHVGGDRGGGRERQAAAPDRRVRPSEDAARALWVDAPPVVGAHPRQAAA